MLLILYFSIYFKYLYFFICSTCYYYLSCNSFKKINEVKFNFLLIMIFYFSFLNKLNLFILKLKLKLKLVKKINFKINFFNFYISNKDDLDIIQIWSFKETIQNNKTKYYGILNILIINKLFEIFKCGYHYCTWHRNLYNSWSCSYF